MQSRTRKVTLVLLVVLVLALGLAGCSGSQPCEPATGGHYDGCCITFTGEWTCQRDDGTWYDPGWSW